VFGEFGRIALPWAPRFIRTILGKKISARFRGVMPKLGLTKEICESVEQRHELLLSLLEEHFNEHAYILGEKPSLADFSLYGPLYAHIYHDPEPRKLLEEQAPNVVAWIERLSSDVESKGEWLENDEVPSAIQKILQIIMEDQIPLLLEATSRVDKWASENPGKKNVPPAISGMNFSLLDADASRMVLTSPVWKLQRVLRCINDATTEERKCFKELLGVQGKDLLDYQQQFGVTRENNKVVVAL
jgi:hypothetical protein